MLSDIMFAKQKARDQGKIPAERENKTNACATYDVSERMSRVFYSSGYMT